MRFLALIGFYCLCSSLCQGTSLAADDSKEALQKLQEFVGQWKASGGPDGRNKVVPIWSETIEWSWKFKGDEVSLMMKIGGGKYLKGGELRYLTEKKAYQLDAIDIKGEKLVFTGKFAKDILTLERLDKKSDERQQLVMNTAAEGIRFLYRFKKAEEGRTLFTGVYIVQATKEGESLGAAQKKNECVVSGGAGTMTVSFKGETFYVCCSGCADAFKETPEKYIAEFKAKKKK
ncbi:MAG: hypothetical protein EXS11_03080 [Gemmataceae bacterium]|nr:hypothetical protein [Gemmataceae bacterium]